MSPLGQFGQLDVNASPNGGAQVGRTERQESQPLRVGKVQALGQLTNCGYQATVDLANITALEEKIKKRLN